jgi:hypothetical protein
MPNHTIRGPPLERLTLCKSVNTLAVDAKNVAKMKRHRLLFEDFLTVGGFLWMFSCQSLMKVAKQFINCS